MRGRDCVNSTAAFAERKDGCGANGREDDGAYTKSGNGGSCTVDGDGPSSDCELDDTDPDRIEYRFRVDRKKLEHMLQSKFALSKLSISYPLYHKHNSLDCLFVLSYISDYLTLEYL